MLHTLYQRNVRAHTQFFVEWMALDIIRDADGDCLGVVALELGNAKGQFVAVLHPYQVSNLRRAIAASTGAVWGGPSTPAADLGSLGTLYGVDIVQSSNCASVNANADRQGVMMPLGNQSGLAYVLKTGAKTEFQRDASLRATEIVVTAVYGHGCVNASANGGVKIITNHE
jgi:hypothetical protein